MSRAKSYNPFMYCQTVSSYKKDSTYSLIASTFAVEYGKRLYNPFKADLGIEVSQSVDF